MAGASRWSSSQRTPPARCTSDTAGVPRNGASVANILEAAGFDVQREYYINDAGRQMHILALSVWLRYLERRGRIPVAFPSNGYRGAYVHEISAALERRCRRGLRRRRRDPDGTACRPTSRTVATRRRMSTR